MTKKKLAYEAPKTETQELRFEGALLTTSGDVSAKSWTPGSSNWFDDED